MPRKVVSSLGKFPYEAIDPLCVSDRVKDGWGPACLRLGFSGVALSPAAKRGPENAHHTIILLTLVDFQRRILSLCERGELRKMISNNSCTTYVV